MNAVKQRRAFVRRTSVAGVAMLTAGALFAGATPALASSTAQSGATGSSRAAQTTEKAPELTPEQRQFIEKEMGAGALAEISRAMQEQNKDGVQTRAFPIAAAAVAAAAWCARGALASVPTSALSDVADGKFSGKNTYIRNAIIGCLGGEIGGWAWKVLPGWVKNKAVAMVAAFIIKYIR